MCKTERKSDKIKAFIDLNTPKYNEIVKFVVVDVNQLCTAEEYSSKNYKGYYSTNISKWRKNEQVDKVDGHYFVTKIGRNSKKSLYSLPTVVKVKRLEEKVDKLQKENERLYVKARIQSKVVAKLYKQVSAIRVLAEEV